MTTRNWEHEAAKDELMKHVAVCRGCNGGMWRKPELRCVKGIPLVREYDRTYKRARVGA